VNAPDAPLFDAPAVGQYLDQAGVTPASCRRARQQFGDRLRAYYDRQPAGTPIVQARTAFVDLLLRRIWATQMGDVPGAERLALVAVGGYGRGELHPCSDVDVMILLPDTLEEGAEDALSAFVTALWDIGLEIGHSARTVAQCEEEAAADLTVATTLMEARLLDGPEPLFLAMQDILAPGNMWPSNRFFEEKRKEQIVRHHRYHDTAYNLEPNVKGSPGGLRDIQMIGWVAKRHFNTQSLHTLVERGFLTESELQDLKDGRTFLWEIRYALHLLAGPMAGVAAVLTAFALSGVVAGLYAAVLMRFSRR